MLHLYSQSAPSASSCDAPVPSFTFSSPPVAGWQAPPVARQPVSVAAWPAWAALSTPAPSALHGTEGLNLGHQRPPPSPLFAMPCPAQLDSAIEDCILHCTAAAPSLHRNARRCSLGSAMQCTRPSLLARGSGAEPRKQNSKIGRKGSASSACTGVVQVGLRENRRVDVAQRKAGQTHYRLLRAQGYGATRCTCNLLRSIKVDR